jgi:hypothetical protein
MIVALHLLTACGDGSATEVGTGVPLTIPLTSSAFDAEGPIPAEHTCGGSDMSPPLRWDSVPDEARSLVLVCDDPDAPGGTWVHWVFYDLPPDMTELPAEIPAVANPPVGGTQGENDFGDLGYGGPCPPAGNPHRYFFRLYALDRRLELAPGATKAQVLAAADEHMLARGELVGTFGR